MVYATLFVFTVEKNVFIIHSIITYYVCIITEWALSFFCFFFFFGLSGIITRSKKKTKKQRVFLFIWISYRVQEAKCGMQEAKTILMLFKAQEWVVGARVMVAR
ncbi:hypothetical protein AAZX31_07G142600 [Glycine max]